jgi:putative oxidoreductase
MAAHGDPVSRFQRFIDRNTPRLAWIPPAFARLVLGLVFTIAGWAKLKDLDRIVATFRELGIPAPGFQAGLVATVELVGGILLILGLATRFAAVPLFITMVVAILTAIRPQIHNFSDFVDLQELAYIVLLVWFFFAGAGALSLDHLIARRLRRRAPAAASTA